MTWRKKGTEHTGDCSRNSKVLRQRRAEVPNQGEMAAMADLSKDRGLVGNRKLEEQIGMLQKEPSQEMLAVVLTTVRRRMKEHGQMIVPVEADASGFLRVQIMQIEDGEKWLAVYTGFEEQMMGGQSIQSTFLSDIGQLLNMALQEDSVEGLLINPWNRSLRLSKNLIRIILGEG